MTNPHIVLHTLPGGIVVQLTINVDVLANIRIVATPSSLSIPKGTERTVTLAAFDDGAGGVATALPPFTFAVSDSTKMQARLIGANQIGVTGLQIGTGLSVVVNY